MRGKWLLFSGSVILLAVGAGALSVLHKPAPPPVKKAELQKPAGPAIGDEVAVTGRIQAAHIMPIPAPLDGILEAWDVEVGQEVVEGQLIGHVQNTELQASSDHAQQELEGAQSRVSNLQAQILAARLEAARAEADSSRATGEAARLKKIYVRQQMLYKEGATPRLEFERAEKDYRAAAEEARTNEELAKSTADRVARMQQDIAGLKTAVDDRMADVERAKESLESSNLLAPADGMVIKLGVEAGGEVDRSMRDLVQLAVDPALLEVAVEPEPGALEKVKPGQPALVLIPDVMSGGLEGEVKEIKGKQVIVEFNSPNPVIKHGMMASVRIKIT